jgi:hypothetical protein
MQNTLTSLLYLMQDYDCISPGTVWYRTVLYQKMVPYGTVWYDTCTVPYGTRFFFFYYFFCYNLPAVDRGRRPLLAAYHRCPHLQSTQLPVVAALPEPTIPCYIFLFNIGNLFSKVEHAGLLAGDGLDIRVA